jgi:HPt (histidine-containing phosphotransfer) domain-containing protein/PAS domain-containing protein
MRQLDERTRNLASTIGFLALLVAFIGLVLVPGFRLASDLSSTTATLKLVSEQRGQADAIARSLATLRDQLEAGRYVGKTLKELAAAATAYDGAVAQLRKDLGAEAPPPELEKIATSWGAQHARLAPITGFKGVPYRDSDAVGVLMTAKGRELLAATREAIRTGRQSTTTLTESMAAIGAGLERSAVERAQKLRQLMVVGMLFATALVALLLYVQLLKGRHERAAREAQNQTRDILDTVKEGLFLIDSDFRVGQVRSSALKALLRRDQFDGIGFDDLLFGLVPEKTLETAMKYVKLLWGERANENLIKSINPLAEVEVRFPQGDVRYLEFDFHRVKGGGGVRQVLVSVTDVTSRVLLARELQQSQVNTALQMDVLLGILKLEPQQLTSFLDDSDATLNHVNSVLKVPARDDAGLRRKVDELFREMHKVKGEAAALGIESVESRAHAFEDLLRDLREKQELGGNDFLPLVVRLDDLFAHLKSLRELLVRLDALRSSAPSEGTMIARVFAPPPQAPAARARVVPKAAAGGADPLAAIQGKQLADSLDKLAQRVASDHGKQIKLATQGLEHVPGHYLRAVRGIAIQFVRNAVVHGVEGSPQRQQIGKGSAGTLQLACRPCSDGFELFFQDDGAGLDAERIRAVAIERGVVGADEAAALGERATLALIFRPGFSTSDDGDRDAGRGVGLDLVSKWVTALGGQISVSTSPGKFTRFHVLLPAKPARQGAVA